MTIRTIICAALALASCLATPAAASPAGTAGRTTRIVVARDADSLLFFLPVTIGGVRIVMIVDTGCTNSILTPDDAKLLAGRLAPAGEVVGAGITGTARMALVTTPALAIGGRDLGRRQMVVGREGIGVSLLGQRELMALGSVTIGRDTLVIDTAAAK